MRIFRKTLVASISLAAFVFILPFELMQGVITGMAGKHRFNLKFISEVYAEIFCSVDEAVQIVLPGATDIKEEIKVLTAEQKKLIQEKAGVDLDPEFGKDMHFYTSASGAAVVDTVKGKWGPIKYMLSFDAEGSIKDLVVLELTERRGRPVRERKFLDQYIGKSTVDPIKLKKDIKGIGGATISSRQMTDGIRKLEFTYAELYRK